MSLKLPPRVHYEAGRARRPPPMDGQVYTSTCGRTHYAASAVTKNRRRVNCVYCLRLLAKSGSGLANSIPKGRDRHEPV